LRKSTAIFFVFEKRNRAKPLSLETRIKKKFVAGKQAPCKALSKATSDFYPLNGQK